MLMKNKFCLFMLVFSVLVDIQEAYPKVNRTKIKPALNVTLTKIGDILNNTNKTNSQREVSVVSRDSHKDPGYIVDFADQDIIFPDAYQIIFESKIRSDHHPPKCADDLTYCENYDAYPTHKIKNMLRNQRIRPEFFGTDEAPDEKINISNRIGEEEEFFCSSSQQTIFPNIGKNKNNKWKIIINQNDGTKNYVQGVRVETCRRDNEPCHLLGVLPFGYTASCKQKFIYRRLMALDDNDNVIPDSFLFPSACCCVYKKDIETISRMGAPMSTPRRKIMT